MKQLIKRILREGLLTEKLTNIDEDVNLLYTSFFEYDVKKLEKTGLITNDMFLVNETNTSILKTEDCVKANESNNCVILINEGSNFYKPSTKKISISVNDDAINYVKDYFGGDLTQGEGLILKEFTEEKIKGSIHHELVHWIDDTLNNRHLSKRLNKTAEAGTLDLNNIPVNSTKFEIQAQIHNIKQLYNKHSDIWDTLSFEDMIKYSPPLNTVFKNLPKVFKTRWIRDLKTRMYRENLLGKNMNNS